MSLKYRVFLVLLLLIAKGAGLSPLVQAIENDAMIVASSEAAVTFVLGTEDNRKDLLNVSREAELSVEICPASEAAFTDFSNKSILFLASLDDRSLGAVNSTMNPNALVLACNLSANARLGLEDFNVTQYSHSTGSMGERKT